MAEARRPPLDDFLKALGDAKHQSESDNVAVTEMAALTPASGLGAHHVSPHAGSSVTAMGSMARSAGGDRNAGVGLSVTSTDKQLRQSNDVLEQRRLRDAREASKLVDQWRNEFAQVGA